MTPLIFLKKTLITRIIQKNNELSFIFCDLFYHLIYFVLDLKFYILINILNKTNDQSFRKSQRCIFVNGCII
jgi:hypothetical protein